MTKRSADDLIKDIRCLQSAINELDTRRQKLKLEEIEKKETLIKDGVWKVHVYDGFNAVPSRYFKTKKEAEKAVETIKSDYSNRYICSVKKTTEDDVWDILNRGLTTIKEDEPLYKKGTAFEIYTDDTKTKLKQIVLLPLNISINLFQLTPITNPHVNRITMTYANIYIDQCHATEEDFLEHLKCVLERK